MVVQKVSMNMLQPQTAGFGLSGVGNDDKSETSTMTAPKKDYRKVLAWSLGGLAVLGLAGVLIYNARKGRAVGGSSATGAAVSGASFSLGAFAKKFADESIFAKTIEKVQNKVEGIKYHCDKGCWELSNDTEQFGCRLLKSEQPDATGFVSCFDFSSRNMEFRVLNHKDGKTVFNVGELAITVDSSNGKVSEVFSPLEGLDNDKCQKFVDDLDLTKLIDDADYRKNYCQSVQKVMRELEEKQCFSLMSKKTGRTPDELKVIQESAEFQEYWKSMAQLQCDINGVNAGLSRFQGLFNVPESLNIQKIFGFVEGKDKFYFLEDFVNGNKGFKYSVNMVEDGSGLIPRQTVAQISDLSVPNEKIKIADGSNGEFFAYEKFNEDKTEFVNIRYYNPAELKDANARVTQILTKDLSLEMEETATGIQRLSVKRGGEEISDAEKTTLMTALKADTMRAAFVKDFVTRGKEMLEELAK